MAKVLFLCSANKDRSIMAAEYFSRDQACGHHAFESAGVSEKSVLSAQKLLNKKYPKETHKPRYATEDLLRSHDVIYVMEQKHKERILDHFITNFPNELDDILKKLIVLDIPDIYSRYDNRKMTFCDIIDRKLGEKLRSNEFNFLDSDASRYTI